MCASGLWAIFPKSLVRLDDAGGGSNECQLCRRGLTAFKRRSSRRKSPHHFQRNRRSWRDPSEPNSLPTKRDARMGDDCQTGEDAPLPSWQSPSDTAAPCMCVIYFWIMCYVCFPEAGTAVALSDHCHSKNLESGSSLPVRERVVWLNAGLPDEDAIQSPDTPNQRINCG